ncbi:MAG: GFA family protein [Accumulibacter sp.]|jgi:hypothetical protein|uniref:GFA family protein n=1 Tax=Accumulibacter sp. TaxID=2053492 RepID=UPI002FC37C6D
MSESATTVHQGRCLCGAIHFAAAGEPMMTGFCYCESCRRLSGAGHAFHALWPEAAVTLSGAARDFAWQADSGATVTTSFCPTCGSPLFGRSSGMPGMLTLRVANLDAPEAVTPQMAVYAKRRLCWDSLDPNLPAFDEMPPIPAQP